MNDTASVVPDLLPLRDRRRPSAPLPQSRKLNPLAHYRALRANSIAVWREEAYEAPILVDRSPMGAFVVVNAPEAFATSSSTTQPTIARTFCNGESSNPLSGTDC